MSSFQLQDSKVEQNQVKQLKWLINEPYKHTKKFWSFWTVKNPCNKALLYNHCLQNVQNRRDNIYNVILIVSHV